MIAPDVIDTGHGTLTVQPVNHASLVLISGDVVLYVDPVGGVHRYDSLPRPTGILITHEHRDHLDPETIADLMGGRQVPLIANVAAREHMPTAMRMMTAPLPNGETGSLLGVPVEAHPAYNSGGGHHPQGSGNGYLVALGGARIYIAGDTEDVPELKALRDVDVMFLPMNQPYTMTPQQVAAVINAVRPGIAYVYHYKGSDPAEVAPLIAESGTELRLRDWYEAA